MDRREAIKVIGLMKRQLDIDTTIYDGFLFEALAQIVEKQQEALSLAIEALGRTDTDCISRQQAVEAVTNTIREKFSLADWYEQLVETGKEIEALIESLPPVETKPVCEDAISRSDTLKELCAECDLNCEDVPDKEAYCTEYAVVKGMPPVEPERPKTTETMQIKDSTERPKGEWVPCTEPPEDRRNVFLAHGTNDFKSCCIGHYQQGMGWYEDRNFFAKPIYDCKYWCDIPELPDMGDNQFDMRGDKE